jgi:MFS family permease
MSIGKKQLVWLFFCSLIPWIVGNSLVPLLPVYAVKLGANSAVAGYSLAFSYLALALGAISAGWVSDWLHRRKLPLIMAGLIAIPTPWLMGQVSTVWGFTVFTACLWFCGGLGFALISILAGLSSNENERGTVFGVLTLSGGLGALAGSLGSGWLVTHWGYTAMFNALVICLAFWPPIALLLEEKEVKQARAGKAPDRSSSGLGKSFHLLFTASILSSITMYFIVLIRSIMMNNLKFSPLEITSTSAIGSLVGGPLLLLMGWLSDRIDRKSILITGYLAALASLLLLAFSKVLWNFWAVFALQGIASGSTGIGNALVADLIPYESLGKGLAVFGSAGWIGGVIGSAAAGVMLLYLGFWPTFLIGGCLVVTAIGLLVPVRARTRKIGQPDTVSI